jgi:UPF0755 protein
VFGAVFAVVAICCVILINPPASFPAGTLFEVPEGGSVTSVAEKLKNDGFIASAFVFRQFVSLFGGQKIIAGDYYFQQKTNVIDLARRITHGIYGLVPLKVTIPEGFNVREIAALLADKLPSFDEAGFISAAQGKEGYLFPDTYYVMPDWSAHEIVDLFNKNFQDKIGNYQSDIASSTHSLSDIVTVASIVEKEASTPEDRRIVSGIIWNRLAKNMPLQIDATLGYVLNKGTFQLTQSDLKLDNPYNTYLYKGLPPTPIGNPGIDAIEAALHPTKTDYLYYLSDNSGTMHYAKTFEEHKENREKYLGK